MPKLLHQLRRGLLMLAVTAPLLAVPLLIGCQAASVDEWPEGARLKIVATFAPIHCFLLNIAPEAEIRSLLSTQGPHHVDPPVGQAKMLSKADILFANGLLVDDLLVRKMLNAVGRGGPRLIQLGNALPREMLLEGSGACCKHHVHDADHPHDHVHIDGHIWLGIEQTKQMVRLMGKELDRISPAAAAPSHSQRAEIFAERLDRLQADGLALLKDKTERMILPFHGSLAYFARSFQLELIDPIQEVPGSEPTAKHLEEIIQKCLQHKVRVIAVEPQYGADTSARAVLEALKQRGVADAAIIVIDPLETIAEGEITADWYERKMRENLANLAAALR